MAKPEKHMIETALIALSLSMDAFAVSLTASACAPSLARSHMVRASLAFGLFQFMMPIAGWFLGAAFSERIDSFDHWIAFGLLAVVGGKMLVECVEGWMRSPDACPCPGGEDAVACDVSSAKTVLVLAVATSIDALAVGVGLSIVGSPIALTAGVVGLVTFCLCLAGFFFGRKLGCLLGRYAQLAGGLVLIAIGVRILVEHLSFGA